jgi:hypothetical protein
MNLEFSPSVNNVMIWSNGTLEATLTVGRRKRLSIDLNKKLGNDDGHFQIGGKDFSKSGQFFQIRQYDGKYFLSGNLKKRDNWTNFDSEISLDRLLVIRDRELVFRRKRRDLPMPRRRIPPNQRGDNINIECNIL